MSTTVVDMQHVKEGHAHLRPPQPATLGNDHGCACSRQIDTPPIGPKHAQISLEHKTHGHIALTSIEQQVILFGNSSFINKVGFTILPNVAVIGFRRDTHQRCHSDLEGSAKRKKTLMNGLLATSRPTRPLSKSSGASEDLHPEARARLG